MNLSIGIVDENKQVTSWMYAPKMAPEKKSFCLNQDPQILEEINLLVYEDYCPLVEKKNLLLIKEFKQVSPKFSALEELEYSELRELLEYTFSHHLLKNNISLIENLVEKSKELRSLYDSKREDFFLNFWQLLKGNLGTLSLDIYFNTINKKDEKKLQLMKISGNNAHKFSPADENETKLFTEFNLKTGPFLHCHEFDAEKGELTLSAMIGGSSVLIMARVLNFTLSQQSILRGLLNGIAQK